MFPLLSRDLSAGDRQFGLHDWGHFTLKEKQQACVWGNMVEWRKSCKWGKCWLYACIDGWRNFLSLHLCRKHFPSLYLLFTLLSFPVRHTLNLFIPYSFSLSFSSPFHSKSPSLPLFVDSVFSPCVKWKVGDTQCKLLSLQWLEKSRKQFPHTFLSRVHRHCCRAL